MTITEQQFEAWLNTHISARPNGEQDGTVKAAERIQKVKNLLKAVRARSSKPLIDHLVVAGYEIQMHAKKENGHCRADCSPPHISLNPTMLDTALEAKALGTLVHEATHAAVHDSAFSHYRLSPICKKRFDAFFLSPCFIAATSGLDSLIKDNIDELFNTGIRWQGTANEAKKNWSKERIAALGSLYYRISTLPDDQQGLQTQLIDKIFPPIESEHLLDFIPTLLIDIVQADENWDLRPRIRALADEIATSVVTQPAIDRTSRIITSTLLTKASRAIIEDIMKKKDELSSSLKQIAIFKPRNKLKLEPSSKQELELQVIDAIDASADGGFLRNGRLRAVQQEADSSLYDDRLIPRIMNAISSKSSEEAMKLLEASHIQRHGDDYIPVLVSAIEAKYRDISSFIITHMPINVLSAFKTTMPHLASLIIINDPHTVACLDKNGGPDELNDGLDQPGHDGMPPIVMATRMSDVPFECVDVMAIIENEMGPSDGGFVGMPQVAELSIRSERDAISLLQSKYASKSASVVSLLPACTHPDNGASGGPFIALQPLQSSQESMPEIDISAWHKFEMQLQTYIPLVHRANVGALCISTCLKFSKAYKYQTEQDQSEFIITYFHFVAVLANVIYKGITPVSITATVASAGFTLYKHGTSAAVAELLFSSLYMAGMSVLLMTNSPAIVFGIGIASLIVEAGKIYHDVHDIYEREAKLRQQTSSMPSFAEKCYLAYDASGYLIGKNCPISDDFASPIH